ncbi:MAG TPA: glycosyl hydrolase family 28-related protein [Tichowtungia sp.]|nr:glycosyl hydrolase family 28-related protein [Tichowtungia sp.]
MKKWTAAGFCRLAITLAVVLIALPASAQITSVLWGVDGEAWDSTNGPLKDLTDVGYMNGDVPIPDWPTGVNVTNFGAVGDGVTDCTQAFMDAIAACPSNRAVFIPNGRYKITQQIVIDKDNIVLRGEDMYETIIWLPKYLTEIYTYEPGYLPPALDALAYDENGQSYTGTPLGEVFIPHDENGTPAETGKNFTQLIRDGHPKNTGFFRKSGGSQVGIENLYFELRDQAKGWHWEGIGADPIQYDNVTDCWIRNVAVKNVDHGISIAGSTHVSVLNTFFDAYTLRGYAHGHAGIHVSDSNHLLVHNVRMTKLFIHCIMITGGLADCVFSKISGYDIKMDHHSMGGIRDLFTEIDFGKGSRPFSSSNGEIYWGLTSRRPIPYSEVSTPENNVVIGMKTDDPSDSGPTYWHETLDPSALQPQNLYIAQMEKTGKPLPEYPFPEKPCAPGQRRDFLPVADTTVYPATDSTFAYNDGLTVGDSGSEVYLKFDLSESGIAEAGRAILKLYDGLQPSLEVVASDAVPSIPEAPVSSVDVVIHAVEDDSWQEHDITGRNAPAAGALLAEITMGSRTWHEIDLTQYIQSQLAGDHVASLRISLPPQAAGKVYITSSDSRMPPHLTVTPLTEINEHPVFVSDPVVKSDATEGLPYDATLEDDAGDSDADDILTYSKTNGPAWLNVASDGALSGTPLAEDVGLNSFRVEVFDGKGGTDFATLEITVLASPLTVSYETSQTANTDDFPALPTISSTDPAHGLMAEHSFTPGNWDATALTDGTLGDGDYIVTAKNNSGAARYVIDLGSLQSVGTVNSYSYGKDKDRAWQIYTLYGSTADTTGTSAEFNESDSAWTFIASVNTTNVPLSGRGLYGVSSISGIDTGYRELMWVAVAPNGFEHTVWNEFDVIAGESTPLTGYDQWASANGAGAATNDFDSDGVNNLAEYALGGNPTNALNQGTLPVFSKSASGFIYVHPQRSDDTALTYWVETCTNLMSGTWTNQGYRVTGTNVTGGALDFVTNDVDTVENEKFIRLKIGQ